jgi:hypothetical protein
MSDEQYTAAPDAVKSLTAADYLSICWKELRDDASSVAIRVFTGKVSALCSVGLLTEEQRELWLRRSATCPGHDGRAWCAFCGLISEDEADGRKV